MKLIKFAAFCLLAVTLCFSTKAFAVKAYPFPVEVKQPNGETITIQAHGDEFFHYTTTTDGYIIDVDGEGYFTFAEINREGNIQPGKVKVSANTLKSSNNSFLKANSPEFIQNIKEPALLRRSALIENIAPLRSENMLRSAKNTTAETDKVLVILAAFTDVPFSVADTKQAFINMLNQSGYSANGGTGSVRDYFNNSSDGNYLPDFDVYGPVTLPQNMAFYGENVNQNDQNPGQMIVDACNAVNNNYNINFADYDLNKDGFVDKVCVIYSGYNEAENSKTLPNSIWPHQYYLSLLNIPQRQRTIDNVVINCYMCTSELKGQPNAKNMAGIGTFTHEYGHTLGLPDLYDADGDVDGDVTTEPVYWDIMSNGNYLDGGNTPPSYSAIERWWKNWLSLHTLDQTSSGQTSSLTIPPITSSSNKKAYVVKTPTEFEFFTLEVRKKEGQDLKIYGEGMLIYHIDMSQNTVYSSTYGGNKSFYDLWGLGTPNIVDNHPGLKLMTANRETMPYSNYPAHVFPGTDNVTSISDDTNPGFLSWSNQKSNISISNIVRNDDGSVSFNFINPGGSGIKKYSTDSPAAYSDGNIIYFNNITENTLAEIFNLNGNKYSSRNISNTDNEEISVPGVYIIKLSTNNNVFTYKVIINKTK